MDNLLTAKKLLDKGVNTRLEMGGDGQMPLDFGDPGENLRKRRIDLKKAHPDLV